MIRFLLNRLFKQQAMINISSSEIKAIDVKSGNSEVLVRKSIHPRTLVGDFFELEYDMKSVLKLIFPNRWLSVQVLICMEGQSEGGYTNIEKRALRDAAYGAGAISNILISERKMSIEEAKKVLAGKKITQN